jgi:hypothetical protein
MALQLFHLFPPITEHPNSDQFSFAMLKFVVELKFVQQFIPTITPSAFS